MKAFINKFLLMTQVKQIIWIHDAIWVPEAWQEYAQVAFEATKKVFKWNEIEVKTTNLTEERQALITRLRSLPLQAASCTIGRDLPRLPQPIELRHATGIRPESTDKFGALHTSSLLRFFKRKKLDFGSPSNLLPPLKKRKSTKGKGVQMQLESFYSTS